MILSELVNDAYLAYRGKLSNVPVSGDEKYTRIVTIANRKQREWAQDSNMDWVSLYQMLDEGTVASGTQTYDLDDEVIRLSDYVLIGTDKITVVKPQTISQYTSGCYVYGADPKQLTFITTIGTNYDGQTLTVPAFVMPDNLVNPTDTVAVDNPQWLVYAVAAELARNDYAKEEQYPNLNGIANDIYAKMVADAQANSFLQPNGVMNAMPQYNTWSNM